MLFIFIEVCYDLYWYTECGKSLTCQVWLLYGKYKCRNKLINQLYSILSIIQQSLQAYFEKSSGGCTVVKNLCNWLKTLNVSPKIKCLCFNYRLDITSMCIYKCILQMLRLDQPQPIVEQSVSLIFCIEIFQGLWGAELVDRKPLAI